MAGKKLTTEIIKINCPKSLVNEDWPEYKRNVKGLVYLEEFDGHLDEDATPIELPPIGIIDLNTKPEYQCIKCGKIQSFNEEIHRIKCPRCFNKAFNKIRPTKWVKFSAF